MPEDGERPRRMSSGNDMLVRIDERTLNIQKDLSKLQQTIEKDYVTHEAFTSISDKVALHQRIIFGVAAFLCLSVLGALLSLVVMRP